MSLIYLASPYTDPDHEVMQFRYEQALAHVHESLATLKHATLYSPVVHYHPVAERYELPRDYEFWKRRNADLICVAKELWVLCLDGWTDSAGVKAEVQYAESIHIPVHYVDPITREKMAK